MNKTALITGSSRGIGRACAYYLAQLGFNIAVNYHTNEDAARSLAHDLQQMKISAKIFQADISQRWQVEKMIQDIHLHLGSVAVLVNNAGIAQQKLFTDITEDDWDTMFNINLKGMFHCTQLVLNDMLAAKSGRIINISSMWGQIGASCEVHYSTAKAAVIGFTKALAKELGPSGITVNCIAPGVIDTDMNNSLDAETLAALAEDTPLGTIGKPDDVGRLVAYLVGEGGNFITGQIIGVNGGMVI